ncbi:MAG TPA: carboxypeptidase-like regulatory domain-containing protein [Rhodothermales bacterium]|nr:carboxypeptidase-like regulatory domain-containing protein [Rhodothermales bacterium]
MRFLALLALLFPLAVAAQGAGTIYGRVVDASGEGLRGARVALEGTPLAAVTDFEGDYRIPGVPAGTYTVTATSFGSEPDSTLGVYVGSGEPVRLDVSILDRGLACCFGCPVVSWEPPLAFLNPDPYASRRLRPADLALLAYR